VVVAKPQPFFAIQLPVCVFLFGLSQQAGFLFCAVSSWGLWVRQFCLSRSDYSFALVGWTRHHLVQTPWCAQAVADLLPSGTDEGNVKKELRLRKRACCVSVVGIAVRHGVTL
jgi:hypothetical protein